MVCILTYFQVCVLIGLSSGSFIRRRAENVLTIAAPSATNVSDLLDQSTINMPWEQLLISGPMTVHLLGQLVVLSSKLDFSFVHYSPNYQFIYIKHPESFRATLVQISNDGWKAFLAAQTNMNQIQLYMQTIPGHVKTAFKLLTNSTKARTISTILPRVLTEIKTISNDCVKLATDTHRTFVDVISLLGEVISVTEVTRGLQETKLKQTEIELNTSRIMQDELNKIGESIKAHYEESRAVVRQAQSEYTKALRKIPSGFKGMIGDFVRVINKVLSVFSRSLSNSNTLGSSAQLQQALANSTSLAYAKMFKDGLDQLSSTITSLLSPSGQSSSSVDPLEKLGALKVTFELYLGSINASGTTDLTTKVTHLIQEGVQLADDYLALGKRVIGNNQSEDDSALRARLTALVKEVEPLAIAESLRSQANEQPAPDVGPIPSSGGNEVLIARMQAERLRIAEKRYDSFFAQLQSQQQQMNELMSRITKLDLTRINYIEILTLLRDALLLLGKAREQWNQLVLFFADIAARAEIALTGTVGPFIDQVTEAGAAEISESDRLFYVDLLKSQAAEINKQAYMLYVMSSTYVEMSDRYLLKRLGGLPQLLSAHTEPERTALLNQLATETAVVQEQVKALVNERKQSFTQAIAARQAELDAFIEKMGGASAGQLAAIEEAKKFVGDGL